MFKYLKRLKQLDETGRTNLPHVLLAVIIGIVLIVMGIVFSKTLTSNMGFLPDGQRPRFGNKKNEKLYLKKQETLRIVERRIDTLYRDIIEYKYKDRVLTKTVTNFVELQKPKDTVCLPLYKEAQNQIAVLKEQVNTRGEIIARQDTVISLKNVAIQKHIEQKELLYNELQKLHKKNSRTITIGPTVSYGINTKGEFEPTIGLGITLKLVSL